MHARVYECLCVCHESAQNQPKLGNTEKFQVIFGFNLKEIKLDIKMFIAQFLLMSKFYTFFTQKKKIHRGRRHIAAAVATKTE